VEGGGTQVEFERWKTVEHRWSLRGGRRWNTGGVWSGVGTQVEFGVESEYRWSLELSWNTGGVWSGVGTQVEFERWKTLEHRWSLE